MKALITKTQVVVEETIVYEWGPFSSPQQATAEVFAEGGEMTWERDMVSCMTRLGTWTLDHRGEEWLWVSRPWVIHRRLREDEK